jgi:hypothetical protein
MARELFRIEVEKLVRPVSEAAKRGTPLKIDSLSGPTLLYLSMTAQNH